MNGFVTCWRIIRGRCIDCGEKALPLPRTYAATGVYIAGNWCRKCHPKWKSKEDAMT